MGSSYRELFKLYDLIQCGDIRSAEYYINDNGIAMNEILPCKGIGVLHLAVGVDPPETSKKFTELLLKHGGDPNLCNDDGITPVHIAAIWGRVENLKLLLGCGGDPARKDFDGHSAFDYAAREQQWDVYDYLHNVVDQLDDSLGSKCAYTLELDKILVTTDQMVAEYQAKPDYINTTNTFKKSEMVRDWCEKTSLVMNKLYPTILGETFLIDNESVPWKNIDFTNNMTLDLTHDSSKQDATQSKVNETNISFKTCLSRKPNEVDITGIQRLEITNDVSDESKNSKTCSLTKQRMSVYENFSLPGSPNSITHHNYNSKSRLKKSNNSTEAKSLLTDDSVQTDLDKAMIIVQNKTNEWLSSSGSRNDLTDVRPTNTRRSSASSGISSNYSGGSIVLANVQEKYKYEDKEEDVVLIEKRLLVTSVVLPIEDSSKDEDTPDQSIMSIASSLPSSVDYDNNTLRAELIRRGFKPGPIQDTTRKLYLKKLQTLKRNPIVVKRQGKTYSIELEKSLTSADWMRNLTPYMEIENEARADFADASKKWREGKTKTSFTYLLLDPRVTNNLPIRSSKQSQHLSWITFVNSIFYVGKGKRSRPYSHLYQALDLWKRDFKTSKDKKVQHILDIWTDNMGVVCLHIFQNVIPAEAFTYEAAMIDVLDISNLKNLKSGNYYGVAGSWPRKKQRMLGLYLLYKAMMIFLSEGERQLSPEDID